jgi:hypothetical protein
MTATPWIPAPLDPPFDLTWWIAHRHAAATQRGEQL